MPRRPPFVAPPVPPPNLHWPLPSSPRSPRAYSPVFIASPQPVRLRRLELGSCDPCGHTTSPWLGWKRLRPPPRHPTSSSLAPLDPSHAPEPQDPHSPPGSRRSSPSLGSLPGLPQSPTCEESIHLPAHPRHAPGFPFECPPRWTCRLKEYPAASNVLVSHGLLGNQGHDSASALQPITLPLGPGAVPGGPWTSAALYKPIWPSGQGLRRLWGCPSYLHQAIWCPQLFSSDASIKNLNSVRLRKWRRVLPPSGVLSSEASRAPPPGVPFRDPCAWLGEQWPCLVRSRLTRYLSAREHWIASSDPPAPPPLTPHPRRLWFLEGWREREGRADLKGGAAVLGFIIAVRLLKVRVWPTPLSSSS
jgi:hypothetical protein